MNAHPHSVPLVCLAKTPALPKAAGFAQHLMQAATFLVPLFEAGKAIDLSLIHI